MGIDGLSWESGEIPQQVNRLSKYRLQPKLVEQQTCSAEWNEDARSESVKDLTTWIEKVSPLSFCEQSVTPFLDCSISSLLTRTHVYMLFRTFSSHHTTPWKLNSDMSEKGLVHTLDCPTCQTFSFISLLQIEEWGEYSLNKRIQQFQTFKQTPCFANQANFVSESPKKSPNIKNTVQNGRFVGKKIPFVESSQTNTKWIASAKNICALRSLGCFLRR